MLTLLFRLFVIFELHRLDESGFAADVDMTRCFLDTGRDHGFSVEAVGTHGVHDDAALFRHFPQRILIGHVRDDFRSVLRELLGILPEPLGYLLRMETVSDVTSAVDTIKMFSRLTGRSALY